VALRNHKLPGRCTDGNGLDDCPVAIGERAREPITPSVGGAKSVTPATGAVAMGWTQAAITVLDVSGWPETLAEATTVSLPLLAPV